MTSGQAMRIRSDAFVLTLACVQLAACAMPHRKPVENPPDLCIDVRGIGNFRSGHPVEGESLESALASDEEIPVLLDAVGILKNFPHIILEVTGHTDDSECIGLECEALSLRRARIVYDWLLAHGAPEEGLIGPLGRGPDYPIDYNSIEEGRSRNRRAEVNIFGFKDN